MRELLLYLGHLPVSLRGVRGRLAAVRWCLLGTPVGMVVQV